MKSRFAKASIPAAALLAAGVIASGCSGDVSIGDDTIDSAELESQLADQLSAQAGVKASEVSVECPDDQASEKGTKFNCDLTAPNGDEVTVVVTMTDDSGNYDAAVPKQK